MFTGTLSVNAQKALAILGKQIFIKQAYLAGGSALALQLGHRRSIDFDFFTDKEFELKQVKEILRSVGSYKGQQEAPKTIVAEFNQIKFSLFYYPYKLIGQTIQFKEVNLASKDDIAAMKLVAITDRGTKKDYIDLYFLANKCFSFEEMFKYYDKKYHNFEVNKLTLLKALQYFEDAEGSEMPKMIEKISWQEVKKFFEKEAIRLAKNYL
jgi:predicted nucleotidyltransferase component of viral defense system